MKRYFFFFIIIAAQLHAQQDYKLPNFKVKPFFFMYSDDSSLVELHITLKISQLVFVKSGQNYKGETELSLYIFQKDKLIRSFSFNNTFFASEYEQTTKDSTIRVNPLKVILAPGSYRVLLKALDKNSGKEAKLDTTIAIPRFTQENIWISSILLYKNDDSLPSVDNIFPISTDSIRYFAEIYYPDQKELKATIRLFNARGTYYVDEKKAEKGIITGKININTIPPGSYIVELIVTDGFKKLKKETNLSISLEPERFIEIDLESYLELLSYIASSSEIDAIKQAEEKDKLRMIDELWKKRDPTPNTSKNEAKDEFFERVKYANDHFTGLRDGWRTDRGKIYIIYGPPDEVESHPFDINSPPYEIWYYYAQRTKFVFIDKNNNGEYELYTPYTPFR